MEDAANEKAEDAENVAEGINETEETIVLSDDEADLLENFRQSQAADLSIIKRPIINCRCTSTYKCGKCDKYERAQQEFSRAYAQLSPEMRRQLDGYKGPASGNAGPQP